MSPILPRRPKRPRRGWGPESVHFFALLRKPLPIPGGAGLIFAEPGDTRPYATDTDVAADRIAALSPPAPVGVSLRFWEVDKSQDGTLEAIEQLQAVTRLVVPRFTPTAPFPRTEPQPGEGEALTSTVVEMATPLTAETASVQVAFRRCFACLEDVSRAYAVATQSMVPRLRIADVHPFVLFISRSQGGLARWRLGFSMYMIPSNLEAEHMTREWERADQDALRTVLMRLREGDPVTLYGERILLARAANDAGEFGGAVLDAAIAAEVLLDALLGLMLWEEQTPVGQARAVLSKSASERLRGDYHGRLGGSWDQSGKGVLGAWRRDLADLRNRVVHAGYRPTEAEAGTAVSAAVALERFIGERVVDRRYAYPRTALLLVGIPGLERRGLWNRRMQELVAGSSRPSNDWHRHYAGWRAEVDAFMCLLPRGGGGRRPLGLPTRRRRV